MLEKTNILSRIEAYKSLLRTYNIIKADENPMLHEIRGRRPMQIVGLCLKVRQTTTGMFMQQLPELMAQKPHHGWLPNKDFWWIPDNIDRRIKAINDALHKAERMLVYMDMYNSMKWDSENQRQAYYRYSGCGFCWYLLKCGGYSITEMPELMRHEPKIKHGDGFWFHRLDFKVRLRILERITRNFV